MARPTKSSLRFRDDLSALFFAVNMYDTGSTAERVSEIVWEVYGLRLPPGAVEDWWEWWNNFAITRMKDDPVVQSR
jgi:hypothetical protein